MERTESLFVPIIDVEKQALHFGVAKFVVSAGTEVLVLYEVPLDQ